MALPSFSQRLSHSVLSRSNLGSLLEVQEMFWFLALFLANMFIASFIAGKLGYTEYLRKIRTGNPFQVKPPKA